MHRTTLSLSDDISQALIREARRRSTSVSAVAREALAKHLGINPDGPRELPFAALGHSAHTSTARDMEDLLRREWDATRDR
jgi:hypothetical protein